MVGLYLHNATFDKESEKTVARGMFGIEGKFVIPIGTWGELATEIKKYSTVDNLVFAFHGYDGGMTVGDRVYDLDDKFVLGLFDRTTTKADKISFVNCRVGNGPGKMRNFAKLFKAKSVSGYTWWLIKQTIKANIPKGATEAAIAKTLEPYIPYSVEMIPAAKTLVVQTKGTSREVVIVVLYGSDDQSTVPIPISFTDSKGHKPWKNAANVTVTAENADAAENAYASSPVTDFELVTVTL
jgi:hypothetical protein